MKKAVRPASEQAKKGRRKLKEAPEWMALKSGAMKHRDGVWYAFPFLDGWFFYTNPPDKNLGPFKSFEDGLRVWKA
jgi:hypothetical protein